MKEMLCPLQFKGPACGYTGDAVYCDKSSATCANLDNLAHFGGYPVVPEQPALCTLKQTAGVGMTFDDLTEQLAKALNDTPGTTRVFRKVKDSGGKGMAATPAKGLSLVTIINEKGQSESVLLIK